MQRKTWSESYIHSQAFEHTLRTSVAAVVSLLAGNLFKNSEAYWSTITTLIVMQSSFGATLSVSIRRLIGTALGAIAGAILSNFFGTNILAFGLGIFLLGVLCSLLSIVHPQLPKYLDRTAFRYSSITLAIVMLVVRYDSAWVVALYRFIEVSVGIIVALVLIRLWPEHPIKKAFQPESSE